MFIFKSMMQVSYKTIPTEGLLVCVNKTTLAIQKSWFECWWSQGGQVWMVEVRGRRGEPAAPPERGTSPATPAAASPLSTSPSCIKRKEHLEECADEHDVVQGKGSHGEEG